MFPAVNTVYAKYFPKDPPARVFVDVPAWPGSLRHRSGSATHPQAMPMSDPVAYKVLTGEQWAALRAGTFQGAPIDIADGFIHLSTEAQLTETVDRHFSGRSDVIIAAIHLRSLGDSVRWEPSRHGQLFPHVYGSLTCAAVLAWCPLTRGANGEVCLPVTPPR